MLTKFDEHPVHQITDSFASVMASDKHWNDGHYICLCDSEGQISLIGLVRLYTTTTSSMALFACATRASSTTSASLAPPVRHRLLRRWPPPHRHRRTDGDDPPRPRGQRARHQLRPHLPDNGRSLRRPADLDPFRRPLHGLARGLRSGRHRRRDDLRRGPDLRRHTDKWFFFRNHSWGSMAGRGGPREHGAPPVTPRRMQGLRQWVLFRMPDHGGFYQIIDAPDGSRRSEEGAILLADSQHRITNISHELEFYENGPKRLKSGRFRLKDETGETRDYEVEDLGWIYCQGGGYFGGFNDGLGQGVWRGEYHVEGEVWDASDPQKIVEADGTEREFDHAWAESFTRLRSGDQVGLAHFEAVVFE